MKKNIPYFYRYYEQNLLKQTNNKKNIELYEFKKDSWTFHSKGIWIYESNKIHPNATFIGSSNYSNHLFLYDIRSFDRDLEMQFVIYSLCDKFNKKLENVNTI